METAISQPVPPNYRHILKTWWPLAASWLLMSAEMPALSAVIARLDHPEINLAAYGGVVFPLALIIESPIIMLLAASTALSRDRQSYNLVRRYMIIAGALLTGLHALVVFTPLYFFVVEGLIGAPPETIAPARIGLALMMPWTWSIAYRRFNQGVMIRFGHSDAVIGGTVIRMTVGILTLFTGYWSARALGSAVLPGIAVGTTAQALSVLSEALYVRWRVQPVLRTDLPVETSGSPLTWGAFSHFYIPLVMTSLLTLLWQPIGSAAISRMPGALPSLAVWPVLSGAIFILRSFGIAYNEVVVALLDQPGAWRALSRFAAGMAAAVFAAHFLLAFTPLSGLYFQRVSALPPALAEMARLAFAIALPLGPLTVYQNWFQGTILYGKRTRGIPESVVIFFVVILVVLAAGLAVGNITGLFVSITGFTLANAAQAVWLGLRARPILKQLREAADEPSPQHSLA
jgi:hypothetical protein